MIRRISEFPLVPMMLRSTWNVWASIGLGSPCLDYDNALVTDDDPRVGGAVMLNKRLGVLRDLDYSFRVSGIRFSGVMAGRQIITILSSQTKNLVVNNKRCSMRDQMLRSARHDKGCLLTTLRYHPVPLT